MKNQKLTYEKVELGQMIFGNPVGAYECTDFVEALVSALFDEIERVYWNKNQQEWDKDEDPNFPGIEYHSYYWGDDDKEAVKPNFKFKDIEVRWYKHPFRYATVNVSMTEKEWKKWFDQCMKVIRNEDTSTL